MTRSKPSGILAAREQAQRIAFGPMLFQAVQTMVASGLAKAIADAGADGASAESLERQVDLSQYAVELLLDIAESADVVSKNNGKFSITATGSMILYDKFTRVNLDFVNDVCYSGMAFLTESFRTGTPAGLPTLVEGDTIYESLSKLPEPARTSWFAFDHYYSDRAFTESLELVFKSPTRRLLDVGGNTGRWAQRCVTYDPNVLVTIADLPGQLESAREALGDGQDRIDFVSVDLLSPSPDLPDGYDVVWMSQFLDCFSEAQIAQILASTKTCLATDGRLVIVEPFVDRQRFEAAKYCLNMVSLYFTALANGNSRMYPSTTFFRLLEEAGYSVAAVHDDIGTGHTMLECRAR